MKRFISAAGILTLVACSPSQEIESIRPDDIAREEIAVYRAILPLIAEANFPLGDRSAPVRGIGRSDCNAYLKDPAVCAKYDAAWADFVAKNAGWTDHPRGLATALSRHFVSELPKPEPSCQQPRAFGLSRVGFDRTFTHAMVQYGVGVGTGPMPQCGWARSSTTLLEKRNGVWVIDRAVDGWVT